MRRGQRTFPSRVIRGRAYLFYADGVDDDDDVMLSVQTNYSGWLSDGSAVSSRTKLSGENAQSTVGPRHDTTIRTQNV